MTRSRAKQNSQRRAFTLIELLVVIGVIAVLAAVVFGGLRGSDRGVALRSAQATIANALNLARTRAITKNVNVALMVHNDTGDSANYRRLIAVVDDLNGTASVVGTFVLPENIYVIPHRDRFPVGLHTDENWNGGDSGSLVNSSFLRNTISKAIASDASRQWEYREMTPQGTISSGTAGNLVVAAASRRPNFDSGYPILFDAPQMVRGLKISIYGLARLTVGIEEF